MKLRHPLGRLPHTAAALCALVAVAGWGCLGRPSWSHMAASPTSDLMLIVNGAPIGLAAVAFVPYGFWVLRTPYWPIGAADLCYFAFAMLVQSARRSQDRSAHGVASGLLATRARAETEPVRSV
jgi:hypothetical protein